MDSLQSFFETSFNNLQEHWEKALLSELKIPEVGQKGTKKLISGATWPTLSLSKSAEVQLVPTVSWKKASNTYVMFQEDHLAQQLGDDVNSGVRVFFLEGENLSPDGWKIVEKSLKDVSDVEVFLLSGDFKSSVLKVRSGFISGKLVHDQGADSVQELALLTQNLINTDSEYIGVYVDSQFFHNIAKLRAARLLAQKVKEETGRKTEIKIIALTSYVGWTLFERYSNMLRNLTAVAASYIGAADYVQSSGYNALVEKEMTKEDSDHHERSLRMSRNTAHVLALESMLGVVEDAAFGSYHLENLTEYLCRESWSLMQKLLQGHDMTAEVQKIRDQRLLNVKTRRTVMSGMNDYPDKKEVLTSTLKKPSMFRVARGFEELRFKMQSIKKPSVYVALYGDYGALNARMNFVKNYFELLGLEVSDLGHSQMDFESFKKDLLARKEEIIVLCASDDKYAELSEVASLVGASQKFIAGKTEFVGYSNLFAGQNIFDVLEKVVTKAQGR